MLFIVKGKMSQRQRCFDSCTYDNEELEILIRLNYIVTNKSNDYSEFLIFFLYEYKALLKKLKKKPFKLFKGPPRSRDSSGLLFIHCSFLLWQKDYVKMWIQWKNLVVLRSLCWKSLHHGVWSVCVATKPLVQRRYLKMRAYISILPAYSKNDYLNKCGL